ncbi:MAG: CpaF family protein [Candidatus Omnitrophica bacterium]|nr:CpaF family protein [Candidatus Omnitrophota bacterium]MCF7895101.1 CpaF family protein [Candidatus Omnitrophota bacterium]
MDLTTVKKHFRHEIANWIGNKSELNADFIRKKAQVMFNKISPRLKEEEKEKIIKALCDDFLGLGPLQELMDDSEVTEIMVNGPYNVYKEKHGKKILTNIKFDGHQHLRYIIEKMLAPTNRRVDESRPHVDFSLKDGSRVNVIIPPLSVGGATITIRKFLRTIENVNDLIKLGTLDKRMAQFLVACIKARVNILFSGATGSGKTTTLEVLSSYIAAEERTITIEDTLEITLRQNHVVRLITKLPNVEGKGEITLRELFINTLRMRPTRIILGELRGAETMDYLQALNSGHRGCLAVIHASRPSDAIARLQTMASYAGLNIPPWGVRRQISSGLNLIVQQEQFVDGTRRITYITEVGDFGKNRISLKDIFRFDAKEVLENGKVKGSFTVFGKPKFLSLFKKKGIEIDNSIFTPDKEKSNIKKREMDIE